jgi:serine/threonine-protein kinase
MLEIGSRLGPFEIQSTLGAGGMGEVYRARDTRLDRIVAIKVLPHLWADADRRARFEREARAIAALDHPHICAVYDVGEHAGTPFLVMQHLDGETLAARLARARGPLPIDQTLTIATAIADALDKAHAAGITHRDLKPANVMLTKSGAKLLDFGLAKLRDAAGPISMTGMTRLATTAAPQTAQGTILGTVHYMSPEQVEGREADFRADIWALGVLMYEMATAKRPFEGNSAASIIGGILKDTPRPVASEQPLTPAALDHIVSRCLEKEPDERWQSAADVKHELQWIARAPAAHVPGAAAIGQSTRVLVLAGVIALTAAVAIGALLGSRYLVPDAAAPQLVQFDVAPPIDATLSPSPVASTAQVALSADGRQLAFVAIKRRGASQIYIRPFDARDAHALPNTDGASFPFWSPDGRFIGFFAAGKLRKIAVAGGTPEIICEAAAGRGGSWNQNGTILFSPSPNAPLSIVSADGGSPSSVTSLKRSGESFFGHNWPQFLPDGRHFLYYQRSDNPEFHGVYAGELGTDYRSPRIVATNGLAIYADGRILFTREGVLFAQMLDVRTFATSGEAVRVADRVGYFSGAFGYSAVSVANGGALAIGPSVATTTSLRWFRRDGTSTGHLGRPDIYTSPRLSFDQKTLAVALNGPTMAQRDVWTIDVARDTASRVTFDPAADWFPTWLPDGSGIYFGSSRLGITSIFRKVGVADDQVVDSGPRVYAEYPHDFSPDGRDLAYVESPQAGGSAKGYTIGTMTVDDRAKKTPFLATPFNNVQPRFAPNGRFIAYASDESGRFDIYVRPFPTGSSQTKVSLAGGMQPEWRRDGKELFYVSDDGKMMGVPVAIDGEFRAGAPHALFDVETPEAAAPYPTHYAVTADGGRFLVNTVVDQSDRPVLTVMLNWQNALTSRVSTR